MIAITGEQAVEAGLIDGVKPRIDAMHCLTHEVGGKGWASDIGLLMLMTS